MTKNSFVVEVTFNKTKQYVANEHKHRKQTNNLNNSTQEKDKRYKKTVEEKQLQETMTCYACGSKEHLIKSCKKKTEDRKQKTTEEAKTALADINMYQGWTAEMYRSTSKDKQIKVTEGYREEQDKTVERSQQKEREDTNTKEDNVTSSTKEIENLKKNLKYIKETLKAITSQK